MSCHVFREIAQPSGPLNPEEGLDDPRIKMPATLVLYGGDGFFERPSLFVGPGVNQCIEYIGDCGDSSRERNRLSRDPSRIALAVPAFVMRQRNLMGQLEDG